LAHEWQLKFMLTVERTTLNTACSLPTLILTLEITWHHISVNDNPAICKNISQLHT